MTHFERLGLPGRFDVDPVDLERAYLLRSRDVHPDHHLGGLDAAAGLNEAYQTLRDPLRRAEYLLVLLGGPSVGAAQDPAFLMEMMDLRERAEAARDGDGAAGVRVELDARLADIVSSVSGRFAAGDLAGVRRTLDAAKTIRSLRRDVAADG
jgi:molecular chaperone HscB